MNEKKVKYVNHAYNSAIALGALGLILTGIVIIIGLTSPDILNSNGINVGILSLAVGLLGSALLIIKGLKVMKTKNNFSELKKNLTALIILSGILLFLITGGLLMLLVLVYSIIALVNTNKAIKEKIAK
jgi:phosphatidylserine synthase